MNRETHSLDANQPATSYGINTGVTNPLVLGFPAILAGGFGGFNALGGFLAWPISFGPTHMFQAVDSVSYLHGNHNFKFGGEIHRNTNTAGRFTKGRGLIVFTPSSASATSPALSALENFMAGNPAFGQDVVGDRLLQLSNWQFAGFLEDDWRVTPRLTLNLGLRYEYVTPLHEANNQLKNFDPNAPAGTFPIEQVGQNGISSAYNADHKDFAPRIGLAWDVTGKGTTVVHAGYSIVYDGGLPMFVFMANAGTNNTTTLGIGANPSGATIITCPAANANFAAGSCSSAPTTTKGPGTIQYGTVGVGGPPLAGAWQNNSPTNPLFPNTNTAVCGDGLGTAGPPDPGPCSVEGVDRNFRIPYVQNWTLGIEHAFTPNLSLNVAYVGNHGSLLPGVTDINQLNPQSPAEIACAHCEAISDRPYGEKYPYLQFINWISNPYSSNYNGLQVTMTQRTSHGLSFLAGYTYAHALDDESFNIDTLAPQDSTNPRAEYGNSTFDITHRFTLAVTYNLPGIKSPGQLLQGWQLNSAITVQSGSPWGAIDVGDDLSKTGELTDRWDFFGNPGDFRSSNHGIPYCAGVGGPGDFSNPGTIQCVELTPGGQIPLASAQAASFANACFQAAQKVAPAASGATALASLDNLGCYAQGNSVMIPPPVGTFGTMSRDPFRDAGIREVDFSITKSFRFRERLTTEFRAEMFNIFNHPNFTNPYGGANGFGHNDPSAGAATGSDTFGCGCATPDVAAGNPVLGTGGARAIQLGLKLIF